MMSFGRRGRKRKTEDEEEKQKPAKAAKEEAVPLLQGQRVVIEHW